MKNRKQFLAALLALVMLLALGAAQAEDDKALNDAPGAGSMEDFLGTWALDSIQAIENDTVTGTLDESNFDMPAMVFAVEEDGVQLITDSQTLAYHSLEIRINENSGKAYLQAVDDGGNPLALNMAELEGEPCIVFRVNELLMYFKRTSADAAETSAETAGPGETHKDKATVKAAQQALNDAGYDCGAPDGVVGRNTRAAITSYQTDKGLTVTGTVTDELLRSLGV